MGAKLYADTTTKTLVVTLAPDVNGRVYVNTQIDIWSDLIEDWESTLALRKFSFPLIAIGGDVISTGKLGTSYVLLDPWQIAPYEADHEFVIDGNLATELESKILVLPTVGGYTVAAKEKVSTLVEVVEVEAGGGGSFDDLMDARVDGSYGDAIHRILWKARGSISSAASTGSIDSLIMNGGITGAERTTDFTMTNDESAVFISFWAKFQGLDSSSQCMFEFWEVSQFTRYKVWWNQPAKNFVLEFKAGGSVVQTLFPSTLLPPTLRDGSDYPVDHTWMHFHLFLHDVNHGMYINNVLVGTGTGGGVPTTNTITTMRCAIGSARDSLPMNVGGGIAHLRFHKGWADRAAFENGGWWDNEMNFTNEPELWLGWPLTDDGVEITGSGINLTLDNGSLGADGLSLYP